ncbi:hypothetical protein P175DRAFT_0529287 [Aspergillus ochraceoroseus IBT 24754]|uniref:Uncharacterized protein n=1 Tax=Aspergillus ochraceoroseus IBT 24754 TaxID=1392256 RepID=A0A2T5M139_9EURO|nr:uncharacterized protein P175DRAFT_0529287 [Aspergillus ochraceoroseus IBT 24754]PTU22251.1 hypothetical protein P175DRAFT_0529287 [Aspergillus ochraceoroseus IBT 24754]
MAPKKKRPRVSDIKFVDFLEKERKTFNEHKLPLLTYQDNRLHSCLRLLDEDPLSTTMSDTQRWGRSRARRILLEVLRRHGDSTFLLFAISASVSTIQKMSDDTVLEVHQWFNNITDYPIGLNVPLGAVDAKKGIQSGRFWRCRPRKLRQNGQSVGAAFSPDRAAPGHVPVIPLFYPQPAQFTPTQLAMIPLLLSRPHQTRPAEDDRTLSGVTVTRRERSSAL